MSQTLEIGIIGDYDPAKPSHQATNQALKHAAATLSATLNITWLPTPSFLVDASKERLQPFGGIWVSPGSPYRSLTGAVRGIRTARELNLPLIGTEGGFQHALLEYMVNVADEEEPIHLEYNTDTLNALFVLAPSPVPDRPEGAPRLFGQLKIKVRSGSRAYNAYQKEEIEERYSCNFVLNPDYIEMLEKSGVKISGLTESGHVSIIELPDHNFYVATGYQPQLLSRETNPHPLITAYLEAALKHRQEAAA